MQSKKQNKERKKINLIYKCHLIADFEHFYLFVTDSTKQKQVQKLNIILVTSNK